MQKLLAAIRKAAAPGVWAQGGRLARDGAVAGKKTDGDAISVRVKSAGAVAPTVVLYPGDEEWSCDCDSKVDPCFHVTAAIQALTSKDAAVADAGAEAAPESSASPGRSGAEVKALGSIRYRLTHDRGLLRLFRILVQPDGREETLTASLAAAALKSNKLAAIQPTHEDLSIDRLVGSKQAGTFPEDRAAEIFAALARATDVRLDDRKVSVSTELIVPRAAVRDAEDGVVLVIEQDPRIDELVAAGVVRCGTTLHRLGEIDLGGYRLEKLPMRRRFPRSDLGTLVGKVLPDLKKRIPVEIESRRLPKSERGQRPRIVLDLDQKHHTLSVVPQLVYGEGPDARIVDGKLVHLRGPVPVRDEAAERDLLARLRDELHLVPGRRVDFDGGEAVRFAMKLKTWSGASGDEERRLVGQGRLVPSILLDEQAFDVTFTLEAEGGEGAPRKADAGAVIQAWRDGLPLVPLDGGGWAPLPADWLSRFGDQVAALLSARRDEDKSLPPAALPALGELCDALERPRPPSLERLMPLLAGFESLPPVAMPEDLRASLRHYQEEGVRWLCFLRRAGLGAVLADDMGLGKTLQALAAIDARAGQTLVVCPRSVVHNWAAEIERFRPALRASLYHGPRRSIDRSADVILTTYAILRLDAAELMKERFSTVILDEAQAIKNPDSQVARAAYALRADFRVSLSGTPVENRLMELWSQLHFTNRGLLGGQSDFRARFEQPIQSGDPGAAERLRSKIRPFVLRRKKREVAAELPPRTEAVLYCELSEEERAVYDAVRAATRKEVLDRLGQGEGVMAALELLLRLRQASCHSALVPGQQAETSAKVERLVEALEDAAADGHKALVFSQWTSLLDKVEPHLQRAGLGFTRLDGSTRDRASVVASFQDENGPPVMLISLKAGGTGLNLTAADHVFLLDPWWNPAVEDQAADRAHRIGQDRPVMVYRLVAKDTVEEGILALQEKKRGVAEAALGEADRAAGLTRDDLLALLA
ncbi:MAG: DEAD/DEAH box helicase [Byssovorax sp.]